MYFSNGQYCFERANVLLKIFLIMYMYDHIIEHVYFFKKVIRITKISCVTIYETFKKILPRSMLTYIFVMSIRRYLLYGKRKYLTEHEIDETC